MSSGSSRILLDIPCKVCNDHSSGKHYGIFACDGCAGFFKRSIRRNRQYVCKNRGTTQEGSCMVDKTHRNQCRACRLLKCSQVGMNKDAVQHERGPRNSTLRRQMALYFKENNIGTQPPAAPLMTSETASLPFLRPPMFPFPPPLPMGGLFNGPFAPPMVSAGGHLPLWGSLMTADPASRIQAPATTSPIFVSTAASVTTNSPFSKASTSSNASPSSDENNSMKEQAARLLFMTINWPKSLPQFLCLPHSQQLSALQECWPELFLLTAAQFGLLKEESLLPLLEGSGMSEGVDQFKDAIAQLQQLQMDPVEFSCLRALALLKSSQPIQLEQIQLTLARYEQLQNSSQPLRSVKLLMLLPTLRAVNGELLEKVFFKESIGEVPMGRLVCDLYSSPAINPVPTSASIGSDLNKECIKNEVPFKL